MVRRLGISPFAPVQLASLPLPAGAVARSSVGTRRPAISTRASEVAPESPFQLPPLWRNLIAVHAHCGRHVPFRMGPQLQMAGNLQGQKHVLFTWLKKGKPCDVPTNSTLCPQDSCHVDSRSGQEEAQAHQHQDMEIVDQDAVIGGKFAYPCGAKGHGKVKQVQNTRKLQEYAAESPKIVAAVPTDAITGLL